MRLLIRIDGQINSLELWQHLETYGVNLTDFMDYTLIYGKADFNDAVTIIRICALFGNIHVELSTAH